MTETLDCPYFCGYGPYKTRRGLTDHLVAKHPEEHPTRDEAITFLNALYADLPREYTATAPLVADGEDLNTAAYQPPELNIERPEGVDTEPVVIGTEPKGENATQKAHVNGESESEKGAVQDFATPGSPVAAPGSTLPEGTRQEYDPDRVFTNEELGKGLRFLADEVEKTQLTLKQLMGGGGPQQPRPQGPGISLEGGTFERAVNIGEKLLERFLGGGGGREPEQFDGNLRDEWAKEQIALTKKKSRLADTIIEKFGGVSSIEFEEEKK